MTDFILNLAAGQSTAKLNLNLSSEKFSRIKFGHPEGYLDAFSNIYREFAESLKSKKRVFYPNEDDGYETAKFIDACKKSSKSKKWVKL